MMTVRTAKHLRRIENRGLFLLLTAISGCGPCPPTNPEQGVELETILAASPDKKSSDELPELSEQELAALNALGYFDHAPADNPEERKVTEKSNSAFEGYNLYTSRHLASADLTDMDGEVVHTWQDVSPHPAWMHVELQPNGDLLTIAKMAYLARYDWNSSLLWKQKMNAHHDLDVSPEGNIYVLSHAVRKYPHNGQTIPIMDDEIVILSADGEIQKNVPLFPLLRKWVSSERLEKTKEELDGGAPLFSVLADNQPGDVLHTNSIQILPSAIPDIAPKGAILLSVREIDLLVILDPEMREILWSWEHSDVKEQHHATLLPNGNILFFDNGIRAKQSRILEVSPHTKEIVWEYTSDDFHTKRRGSAQNLPSGNILITESDKGHAFEITAQGQKVWQFWNPTIIGDETPMRAVIYRMMRYSPDYLEADLLSGEFQSTRDKNASL
jgi:hypothetical protein